MRDGVPTSEDFRRERERWERRQKAERCRRFFDETHRRILGDQPATKADIWRLLRMLQGGAR